MTGVYTPAVEEWQQVLRAPVFAPRRQATPIPEEDWNSGLIRCFHISDAWIPHILGVLEALDQPDTWIGTDAEIEAARQNVREIMVELGKGSECEEMPENYVKYIGSCNEEGLEVTQIVGGVEGTARIDIWSCLNLPPAMLTGLVCDEEGFKYKAWSQETGEQEISFDLEPCIEFPPVPVPSLVGDNLWFDTDGNGIADVNVGRVVYPGADGADGADAPIPGVFISGGDLYFDADGDDTYTNLGRVKGDTGEPGICEACSPVPAPEVETEETDGLQCSIAINEAKFLRGIWDKAYDDTEGVLNGYIGGLVTGASVIAYFFPGAAVVAGIAGLLLTAMKGINDLESNSFDDNAEERYRCMLYCILKENNEVNFTEAIRSLWLAEIDGDTLNPAALVVGDLLEYSPLDEFQWIAYASSEVSPDACLECECDEPPDPNCDTFDFTVGTHGWNVVGLNTGWVSGQGYKIVAGGSNTIDLQAPLRVGTVQSVYIEATGTDSANRVYVSFTNAGGTPKDTGIAPYFMDGLGLVVTGTRLRIQHDWSPGNTPLGTAVISKIIICYVPT